VVFRVLVWCPRLQRRGEARRCAPYYPIARGSQSRTPKAPRSGRACAVLDGEARSGRRAGTDK